MASCTMKQTKAVSIGLDVAVSSAAGWRGKLKMAAKDGSTELDFEKIKTLTSTLTLLKVAEKNC